MPDVCPVRAGWRRVLLTAAFVVLAVAPLIMQTREASNSDKLTTVLADLARAVPQRQPGTAAARTGRAALQMDAMPASVRDAAQGRLLRIDAKQRAQVYVLMDEVTDEHLQELTAAGATIEISDPEHRRVQARVPVAQLAAVAALPFVDFVRLPTYPVRRAGSVATEGDSILRSSAVRSQLSLDGSGVKVGVISDGLKGVFAKGCTSCGGVTGGPMATGDLPSATGVRTAGGVLTSSSGGISGRSFQSNGDLEGVISGCSFLGAGAEGTALLEIIHDVAPGAQLSFANFDTSISFNQAVNFLAANNDIVVDDIGFYGEASDGTSSVSSNTAAALNNASNRIRAYVTAVGNASDEHYIGTYDDSGVDGATITGIVTPGHLHRFQPTADTTDVLGLGQKPYNLIQLPAGGEVVIFLTWNDPFGRSANNYDLYLVQQTTGRAVTPRGTDLQAGNADPVEFIDYVNTTGITDFFQIVVQNVRDQAAPRDLNIFSFQPQCATGGPRLLAPPRHERHNYNTAARSISAQSDAGGSPVSVISAGAICSASSAARAVFPPGSPAPDESCFDSTNSTIEFFSSVGPTLDGRTKPDITGIDGVSVTAAGQFVNPFFGTSAAAPHVAGIAALALQGAPCLITGSTGARDAVGARTRLRDLIVGNAVGLGDANIFGAGRADAFASLQAALPAFSGPSVLTAPATGAGGAAITAAQLGFSDPNGCALTTLRWSGGCGTSPGTAMTCPVGTTSVSVSASNNGAAFSTPVNVQITVTSFQLTTDPGSATVAPGQTAAYDVFVSPQGGPFPANVTLGCANLPPLTSCSFDPATVAIGSLGAHSTLRISTTAPASGLTKGAALLVPGRWLGPEPLGRARGSLSTVEGSEQTPRGRVEGSLVLLLLVVMLAGVSRLPASSRRRLAAATPLAAAAAILLVQVACGSSKQTPTPQPAVTLSSSSLAFGSQFVGIKSAAQTLTVTNSGSAALAISSISATGDFAQTNTCSSSLAAGASCTVTLTFTPTAAGSRTGALTIVDSATGSPHTAGLTGTGQAVNGTPEGSYQVSVTGTAGSLQQAGSVTLVVQ
jgi:hypothetical protein